MSYLLSHYLTEMAERHAGRPSVAYGETFLTYGELDRLSDRFAYALRDAGIGRGDRVGLCMPKSLKAIAAMLGTLKAGAAYVPIDPSAPARRGGYILRDCGVRAIVSTARKLHDYRDEYADLPAVELVVVAEGEAGGPEGHARHMAWAELPETGAPNRTVPAIETDPAYLLYTSGSTGNPKGVILSHRHARTFVDWGRTTFGVMPGDRLSNHAPLHFDLSVFDIYVALSAGACVSIVPERAAAFPMELARWIDVERISVWYSVPSALVRLLLHGQLERHTYEALRTVLYAGEVFPVKYLRRVMLALRSARFHNLYGPTETNVCTCYSLPAELPAGITDIPIGAACANTEVFAVDDSGVRVEPGAEGELYVRGPALLLGYWGLPERTSQSIVNNPLQPAYRELVYRTGDIVRLDEDGNYRFVGRRDHMVKSRGYRIELGEVEQAIYQMEAVREAAVLALPDEEVGARLHAVVSLVDGRVLTERELQTFCASRLPRYMVPESFVVRDDLPKTSTGKIDRVTLQKMLRDQLHPAES